ncbi:MAG: hypothetical protein O6943_07545 [Bacteroidetes bacterium]|nr:hypothetical protein [Bacteroidota bacterium]TDI75435.1 MAG: hypothetical protein E2O87_02035 [Bacteroidota bacterium]
MKTNYLLPYKFKALGWVLFILGIVGGLYVLTTNYEQDILSTNVLSIYKGESLFGKESGFFKIIKNDILDEIVALFIIVGGMFVTFSREKVEDEFIYKLRKDSLVWAVIFNYSVLLIAILFVYDFAFFDVLVFNMFTPLIFFILRFNFLKLKSRSHEE